MELPINIEISHRCVQCGNYTHLIVQVDKHGIPYESGKSYVCNNCKCSNVAIVPSGMSIGTPGWLFYLIR